MAVFATYASSVLHNGLGRYEVARDAALRVFEQDVFGYGVLVVGELAEAASRTGDTKLVESTLGLADRTHHRHPDRLGPRHGGARPGPARARTRTPTARRSST